MLFLFQLISKTPAFASLAPVFSRGDCVRHALASALKNSVSASEEAEKNGTQDIPVSQLLDHNCCYKVNCILFVLFFDMSALLPNRKSGITKGTIAVFTSQLAKRARFIEHIKQ